MTKIATSKTTVNIAHRLMSWVLIGGLAGLLFAHPAVYSRTTAFALLSAIVGLGWLFCLFQLRCCLRQFAPTPWAAWPVAVICSSAVLSMAFSPDAVWKNLWLLGAQCMLLWVAWWLTSVSASLRRLGLAITLSAAIAGLYAWVQFFAWDPLPPGALIGNYRIISVFDNPNALGNFMACALPLLLAGFLRTASSPRSAKRFRILHWIALYLLLTLVYGGLLLSASRGAWIAGMAGCLIVGVAPVRQWIARQGAPRPFPLLGMALLLAGITLLLSRGQLVKEPHKEATLSARALSSRHLVTPYSPLDQTSTSAPGDTFLVHDEAINHRYFIWQVTWEMIRTHPFRGLGYGNYSKQFADFRDANKHHPRFKTLNWVAQTETTLYAHNEYLHIWAENGIFGLLGFLGLVLLAIMQLLRQLWQMPPREALHAWGLLGMVLAVLVHSLVSYPLHLPLNGAVFWVLLGIVFGWKAQRPSVQLYLQGDTGR